MPRNSWSRTTNNFEFHQPRETRRDSLAGRTSKNFHSSPKNTVRWSSRVFNSWRTTNCGDRWNSRPVQVTSWAQLSFSGKFVSRTPSLVFRFAKKFAQNERNQLFRALVTYLHRFADPPCTKAELSVLTVHAVMQPVALYGHDQDQQNFQLSLEPFLGSTFRVLHNIAPLIVEGL